MAQQPTVKYILYLKKPGAKGSDTVRRILQQIPPQFTRQIQQVDHDQILADLRRRGEAVPDWLQRVPALATYERPTRVYLGSDVIKQIRAWAGGAGRAAAARGGPPHHAMTPTGRMPPPPARGELTAAAAAEPPEMDIPPAQTMMDPSPAMHGAVATDDLYQTRITRDAPPTRSGRRRRDDMAEQIKQHNAMRSGRGVPPGFA